MAKKSMIAKAKRKQKFAVRRYNRVSQVRQATRLFAQIWYLPYMFSRVGPRRRDSRRDKGQLVIEGEAHMMTDPIADMLTRVRNACRAGHRKVDIPSSRMKREHCPHFKRKRFCA